MVGIRGHSPWMDAYAAWVKRLEQYNETPEKFSRAHVFGAGYTDAETRIAALEAALRDIAQAASEAADALAMHDPTTHSRLALQGCFEAIADAALAALREETHDG